VTAGSSPRKPWTEEETLLALYLYFQTPFGKIHFRNPEIQKLAAITDRSSNSIAMKLANFASLDPKILGAGKRGLQGASRLDREMYTRFSSQWDQLVPSAASLWESRSDYPTHVPDRSRVHEASIGVQQEYYAGPSTVEAVVQQRRGQDFFRRAVLANYAETCCITGIAEPRLLVASHILPWGENHENRHNPANGVLLSGTMDKAFDQGLITIEPSGSVLVAERLVKHPDRRTRDFFLQYQGNSIRSAARFDPDPALLEWHLNHRFVDNQAA